MRMKPPLLRLVSLWKNHQRTFSPFYHVRKQQEDIHLWTRKWDFIRHRICRYFDLRLLKYHNHENECLFFVPLSLQHFCYISPNGPRHHINLIMRKITWLYLQMLKENLKFTPIHGIILSKLGREWHFTYLKIFLQNS